jgi:hypothetical protein
VDEVPRIARRYRDLAVANMDASFRQAVNGLIRDLPTELAAKPIPSVDDANIFGRIAVGLRTKKVYGETAAAAKGVCDAHFRRWREAPKTEPGAQQVMDRLVEQMVEEVSDQIRDIQQRYDRVQFVLTGLDPADLAQKGGPATPGEWGKRILGGAFSLISPDYGLSFMNEGIRGLGKSVLLHAGIGFLVGALGGPVGWALAAAIAAGLVRTAIFAPGRIKEQVRQEVVEAYLNGAPAAEGNPAQPGLREIADVQGPTLRDGVMKFFDTLEEGLRLSIGQEVESEEASIREQLANASKGAEEKQALMKGYEQCRESIAKSRAALEQAIIVVRTGRA